jgi:plastocyanin
MPFSKTKRLYWLLALPLVALPLVLACGSSDSPTDPAPPGPSVVTVRVLDFSYEPQSIQINPGTTVRWVHEGQDPAHTVTDVDGAFDSGFAFQQAGATWEHTFTTADDGKTFRIWCISHEDCCDMRGSVRVGQSAPPPPPGY